MIIGKPCRTTCKCRGTVHPIYLQHCFFFEFRVVHIPCLCKIINMYFIPICSIYVSVMSSESRNISIGNIQNCPFYNRIIFRFYHLIKSIRIGNNASFYIIGSIRPDHIIFTAQLIIYPSKIRPTRSTCRIAPIILSVMQCRTIQSSVNTTNILSIADKILSSHLINNKCFRLKFIARFHKTGRIN